MEKMKKLIIIGGKGNALSIASMVESNNQLNPEWEILGFFNDSDAIGSYIGDYQVIGRPEDMKSEKYNDVNYIYALITLPYGENNTKRLEEIGLPLERFATIIHHSAYVSQYSQIGFGVVIMPFVYIGPNTRISNHVTLLAGSSLGHDSVLNDYSYLGNNAIIGAYVTVGKGVFIGTNATIIERVTLNEWCAVGIGSVIIRDVETKKVVAGNPARLISERVFSVFDPDKKTLENN